MKRVHALPLYIRQKVNNIARLEFELSIYVITVQNVRHYFMRTFSSSSFFIFLAFCFAFFQFSCHSRHHFFLFSFPHFSLVFLSLFFFRIERKKKSLSFFFFRSIFLVSCFVLFFFLNIFLSLLLFIYFFFLVFQCFFLSHTHTHTHTHARARMCLCMEIYLYRNFWNTHKYTQAYTYKN